MLFTEIHLPLGLSFPGLREYSKYLEYHKVRKGQERREEGRELTPWFACTQLGQKRSSKKVVCHGSSGRR